MASQAPTAAAAPWRAQLLDHISKLDSPTFTFTSLHPGGAGGASTGSSPPSSHAEPRGRTCVFRGMWASLPPNDKNTAPRNPDAYESDCLTLTTDARMAKVPELFRSGETGTSPVASSSGGGGPVEAMFWVPATGTQWRLRGHAWVLSHADIGGSDTASSPGAKAARDAVSKRMRSTTSANANSSEGWSWEREVEAHFGNLSPGMRGSFKNPPPGTPRAQEPGPGEGLGQKVGDELLGDEVARKNFRVVVIVPEEVDTWDGKDPDDQRRWVYTFVGPDAKASRPGGEVIGGWEKVEVWPYFLLDTLVFLCESDETDTAAKATLNENMDYSKNIACFMSKFSEAGNRDSDPRCPAMIAFQANRQPLPETWIAIDDNPRVSAALLYDKSATTCILPCSLVVGLVKAVLEVHPRGWS